ncbi:autoinducer binding domain-containing protein [Fuscibacter oryzae]|uniref:Autoinducer binding domain-containing protein n=1 Tax=Fuscibacter oryzae TaxID=2803939 RepID=A0A8J7MSS9_9RHOB|nr:autoinducer binding domain-containing protein [Fuscibacter oryzae]MBL4928987.1 autoinducer binding domain-containing protein [Fuscibacter oryzae]
MDIFGAIEAEAAKIGEIAPSGYFLALRIRGTSPLLALKTYPQAWLDRYMENGYLLRDPITTWAMTIGGAIRWSSPLLIDPFRVLRQAAEFGLTYGASVAHGPINALSICSFGRSDRELTNAEIAQVRRIVVNLHERTALPKSLDENQKEVLSAMSQGLTADALAARLGVSRDVTRGRFDEIYEILLAKSPDEALRRAKDYKLF